MQLPSTVLVASVCAVTVQGMTLDDPSQYLYRRDSVPEANPSHLRRRDYPLRKLASQGMTGAMRAAGPSMSEAGSKAQLSTHEQYGRYHHLLSGVPEHPSGIPTADPWTRFLALLHAHQSKLATVTSPDELPQQMHDFHEQQLALHHVKYPDRHGDIGKYLRDKRLEMNPSVTKQTQQIPFLKRLHAPGQQSDGLGPTED